MITLSVDFIKLYAFNDKTFNLLDFYPDFCNDFCNFLTKIKTLLDNLNYVTFSPGLSNNVC